eukprot:6375887-Amphidinium_carterae.1
MAAQLQPRRPLRVPLQSTYARIFFADACPADDRYRVLMGPTGSGKFAGKVKVGELWDPWSFFDN